MLLCYRGVPDRHLAHNLSELLSSVAGIKPKILKHHKLFCSTLHSDDCATNAWLPKPQQHWISVSCSMLAGTHGNVN